MTTSLEPVLGFLPAQPLSNQHQDPKWDDEANNEEQQH
jgi:hypothetical protein